MPENCARVFSPAVAILESEKILGMRFANFSIGFILFLPIQPLDLYRIEEEFVVVVAVWIVTRDHSIIRDHSVHRTEIREILNLIINCRDLKT